MQYKNFFAFCLIFLSIFSLATAATLDGEHQGLLKGIPRDPAKIQFCHLFVVLDNIINFIMFTAMPVLAILYLTLGGFYYVIYIENPSNAKKFWDIAGSLFWGAIVIYTSWIIVNLFLTVVGLKIFDANQTNWFQFPCE